jgi:hypothetical protein
MSCLATNHGIATEPELIEVEEVCPDCDKGRVEVCETRVSNFFDPYNYIEVGCSNCGGSGFVMKEVCSACRKPESECPCCDDEKQCSVQIDLGVRCKNPRSQVVREPFTPAAFEIPCCDQHAESLISQGYKRSK